MDYRRDIDGLRGLAVAAVVLFHVSPRWIQRGYLGVDVFFVISGYLITSIIHRQMTQGTFSLKEFYLRRIRRLIPALAAMLGGTLLAGYYLLTIPGLHDLARQTVSVLLLASNVTLRERIADYWAGEARSIPLLHTWSLSVEEQFYLLFPLLLWGVMRFAPRHAFRITLLGFLASLAWWGWCRRADPSAAFYLLPSRAWQLLAGVALALKPDLWPTPMPTLLRWGLGLMPGCLLLLCLFPERLAPNFIGQLAAVAAAVALLAPNAVPLGLAHRWLVSRPFVALGQVSYSVYLWHWPVLVFAEHLEEAPVWGLSHPVVVASSLVGPVVLGGLSYVAIERPLRRWPPTAYLAGLVSAALLGSGLLLLKTPDTVDLTGFHRQSSSTEAYSINPRPISQRTGRSPGVDYPQRHLPVSLATGVISGKPDRSPDALLLGNSHALRLAPAIHAILQTNGLAGRFWVGAGVNFGIESGFPNLSESEGRQLIQGRAQALAAEPKVIVIAMRYDQGMPFFAFREQLLKLAAHSQVLFIQQPPVLNIGGGSALRTFAKWRQRYGTLEHLHVHETSQATQARRKFETELLAALGQHPNFTFVPTEDLLLLPTGNIRWWDGAGTLYYFDNNHLADAGAHYLRPRIEAAILKALATAPPQP